MILDNFKPLADGFRSTFIELDMQLFFVTFELFTTSISNVRLYVAEIAADPLLVMKGSMVPPEFKVDNVPYLKMREVHDSNLINAFRELYTAKAVKRRMM